MGFTASKFRLIEHKQTLNEWMMAFAFDLHSFKTQTPIVLSDEAMIGVEGKGETIHYWQMARIFGTLSVSPKLEIEKDNHNKRWHTKRRHEEMEYDKTTSQTI